MDPARIDVVVLCGGLGTRLQAVAADRPKPMVAVGGRPFLELLLEAVAEHGFRRFVLCVGYKSDIIKKAHFGHGQRLEIVFSEEQEPLGTAGALKHGEPLTRSDLVVVMNGDSYCPLDLKGLLAFHGRHGGIGTIAAVPVEARTDGGFIELSDDQRIVAFKENVTSSRARHLSAGVYAFGREIFRQIPEGRRCSLEGEVLPSLLDRGLYAYVTTAPLYDIGTPARLEAFRRLGRVSRGAGSDEEGR